LLTLSARWTAEPASGSLLPSEINARPCQEIRQKRDFCRRAGIFGEGADRAEIARLRYICALRKTNASS